VVNDALRSALSKAVPLNSHLGLELLEMGDGRGVVRLPDDPRLLNHVGSQHAAGLFAAGEFASGAAMTSALASLLATATPLAAGASISYRRLAKGPITATAQMSAPVAGITQQLADVGRAEFDVDITMHDADGHEVATMTVKWNVRKRA
jgi:acyl-coenzyme A thioesterase PaaI-like protein